MADLQRAPAFVTHRGPIAAPVPADVADPAVTAGLEARGFDQVAIYWTSSGGADTDTMTMRVLALDAVTGIWNLCGPPVTRRRNERLIVPNIGARIFVRIDAFSNAAINATIRIAGFTHVTRRAA